MPNDTTTRHNRLFSAAMLACAALALAGAAAGAATASPTPARTAATADTQHQRSSMAPNLPLCEESTLAVDASLAPGFDTIIAISVTNPADAPPCVIDRIPTVTFGELNGAAAPVPPFHGGPYVLTPGESAHAAVWTVSDLDFEEAPVVWNITVAASPEHDGTQIPAQDLGLPPTAPVHVFDPATTWWHSSYAEAEEVLLDHKP